MNYIKLGHSRLIRLADKTEMNLKRIKFWLKSEVIIYIHLSAVFWRTDPSRSDWHVLRYLQVC